MTRTFRLAIMIAATAALSGCILAEKRAKEAATSCSVEYGLKKGTVAYAQCMMMKEQIYAEGDERRRMAFAAGLQSMGNSMQANAARSRPTQCTYNAIGNSVYQNCY